MTLIICDHRQRILEAEGHVLVTGGPGSGKTTVALVKAAARIDAGLDPGQSVLFLSFSRAAVARIVEASRIRIPRGLQDNLAIQTFHSFFWQVLRVHGYLLGAPRRLRLLLPHDEKALRFGVEEDESEWLADRERLFREQGLVAFDLFAAKVYDLLSGSERLRHLITSRYPLIVVDEGQDTSEDQWTCIKALAKSTQLLCLADLDQQIYDFRPGVSAERVVQIMEALNPMRVDLEVENHRSPDSEIVKFGNDVLLKTPRGASYRGVSQIRFQPNAEVRDKAIRSSVGILCRKIEAETGKLPERVAIMATWGKGVGIISRALTGSSAKSLIRHQVIIDEASVLLSSYVVAFLLEPKDHAREQSDLGEALNLCAAVFRAKGKKTHINQALRFAVWAERAQHGQVRSNCKAVIELLSIIRELQVHPFTGQPGTDWLWVRRRLRSSASKPLVEIAVDAEQLMAFGRGQRISSGLAETWQREGRYSRARAILDDALAEYHMLSGSTEPKGITVMTVHKSKGKEFDGVVIIDESRLCPLVYCREAEPYPRSRRLLRVGITRARYHVLLLTDLYRPSRILEGHNL